MASQLSLKDISEDLLFMVNSLVNILGHQRQVANSVNILLVQTLRDWTPLTAQMPYILV